MTSLSSNNSEPDNAFETRDTPTLLIDLILEGMKVNDAGLNELASEVLTRFGEQTLDRLVRAAADTKNRPPHRLRLLKVIERIAANWEPRVFYRMMDIAEDRNEAIRTAALGVILTAQRRRGGSG